MTDDALLEFLADIIIALLVMLISGKLWKMYAGKWPWRL